MATVARREKKLITIENTNFIYRTNFSGDPERDRFGSDARKANIIIPDPDQAMELLDAGFNVKKTKRPESLAADEEFVPQYFVSVNVNYDTEWPPKIWLVSGSSKELLDEESVSLLDSCYVLNVNVVLNPYQNKLTGRSSLYVRTMYVEQDVESDPFARRYSFNDEEEPV